MGSGNIQVHYVIIRIYMYRLCVFQGGKEQGVPILISEIHAGLVCSTLCNAVFQGGKEQVCPS